MDEKSRLSVSSKTNKAYGVNINPVSDGRNIIKMETEMNDTTDKGWDHLQSRIDQIFSEYLKSELPENEYKTRNQDYKVTHAS
jgi:hypothetical protein